MLYKRVAEMLIGCQSSRFLLLWESLVCEEASVLGRFIPFIVIVIYFCHDSFNVIKEAPRQYTVTLTG